MDNTAEQSVKHTETPWQIGGKSSNRLLDSEGAIIAETDPFNNRARIDARRICAAVNATASIPLEALESGIVEEMREALLKITEIKCNRNTTGTEMKLEIDTMKCYAERILSKLTPKL